MDMTHIVSITSQGQVTIPKQILRNWGIKSATKAELVEDKSGKVFIKPKKDFWSLGGSLATGVKLTDKQLSKARHEFAELWAKSD